MSPEPPPTVSGHTIRTLHVDDDPGFAELTAEFLERNDSRISVVTEHRASDGLDRLASTDVDCVVSDYDMPGRNGIEFLAAVRAEFPDLPFILFTGKGSEEVASDAVSAGVTDYLQKERGTDQYTVLANRIVNVAEKRRTEADLERRTRQHEAVATLGRQALAATDLPPLFDEAVRLVADRLDCDYASMLELDADDAVLALVSGTGWDEGPVGRATVPAGRESQPGYTLASAEPVVVTDFGADARFGDSGFLADHGVESGVSVVVGSEAEPWGVLGAYATGRRGFTDDDVTFVQNVANVLGGAIDNHRAEAQLRKSEARFREMAELSPDGLFRADTDGTFTYLSPAAGTLLGRPVDELVGEGFHRLVAESSYEDAIDGFGRVLRGEVVRGLTLTVLDDDGEPFDVEVSASPVRRDGEVVMVQGIARDITERRRAERELQRSRERYRTLVENFPNGGVFLFDDDLRYTAAGGRELDAVGVSADDVTGKTPAELFPPENAALLESNYRAALAGEPRSFEDEFQGRRYRIRIVPIRNADGAVVSGMAVSQNVTDRRTRERKLDRLRQRARRLTYTETVTETARVATDAANDVIGAPLSGFHALADAGDALEPVVMADAVDDVFETVPSYPRDEEPGSRAALVWDAFERGEPLLIDDTSAYEPLTEPTPAGTALVHPVGDHGVFVVSAAEPNAYDETDKSLVEILTNSLTAALDRVEREQRLRDRERLLERQNERLDEFASIVSHDLRNPLNVAQGRLALVYEDCESDHLDAVATAHGRMSALIDDLLTLAREGETAGDASVVDLATVVESSWQHVETPGATLVCDADRRVRASQSRLQQLLENLFRNAVEHGSAGVTVTVGDLDDGFYVADDGPGIPDADRERVFEPGYSTDDAGTGFGLAIVSAVVAEHGWELDVTTSADGGARFAITGVERE